MFFFFKQKTAYEMRISDWSSDVCSSDLYKARFKVDPGVYAPYAYDGAWNMITAMKEAGSAKPEAYLPKLAALQRTGATSQRSEERSVGKECVSKCSSRWSTYP